MAKKKSKTKKKVKEIMQKKDDESLHVRSVRPQSKNVSGMISANSNKHVVDSRAETIPMLTWCREKVVLTKKQSRECHHPWGNCSESVPWHALTGRRRSRRHRVVLYSRTISLHRMPKATMFPCIRCRQVADKMNHMGVARIISW